jgi:hypothetical protein
VNREVRVVLGCAGWWLLVVLPALLGMTGVFGGADRPVDVDGWLLAFWVVGYLAQLAWLMLVVPRAVGHSEMWTLFVASLLPWLVDWVSLGGVVQGLLMVAITGVVTTVMIVRALGTARLDMYGRLVTATVVREVPTTFNTVVNNIYVRRKAELEIPAPDGSTYRAVLTNLYEIGTHPVAGDRVRIRVDPGNPKRFQLATASMADQADAEG